MTLIQGATPALDTWTELSGFQQLRAAARDDGKAALPAVAKQFEAIFTQMMLKSMRDANASMGEGLGDSQAGDTYRDLFDQQLSLNLANGGNGLGIAAMLVKQLGGTPAATNAAAADPAALAPGTQATARQGVSALANANLRALLQLGSSSGNDGGAAAMAGELPAAANADATWGGTLARLARGAANVAGAAAKLLPGGDPVDFVRALAPHAQAAARTLGVSPRLLLAQAALETGWGKHLPARGDGTSSFNLFGIKAGDGWDGAKVNVPTLEYEGGVAVRRSDQFRAYGSPAASFADYARLLRESPRYAQALGQGENAAGFARALVRGGYATDPAYAQKITQIANSPQMHAALAALKNGAAAPTSAE